MISGASREKLRRSIYKLNFGLKQRHKKRFRVLSAEDRAKLSAFTKQTYSNTSDEIDAAGDIDARMDEDRNVIIPWIDAALPLDGPPLDISTTEGMASSGIVERLSGDLAALHTKLDAITEAPAAPRSGAKVG